MSPTVDAFHALARSSPWRWTTLRLQHRSARWDVGARLHRPDGVVIIEADGRRLHNSLDAQRPDGRPTRPWRPAAPTYRADGLVDVRPELEDDEGLFWENYSWVAMLDPVELSHHVAVTDLRADVVAGRPVWRADLRAQRGYEPRCGGNCCELLYSEAGLLADFDPADVPEAWRDRDYPDHYDVALDVQTGVVVRCLPVGGAAETTWLENDILEVDADR